MRLNRVKHRKALNKAFLKAKLNCRENSQLIYELYGLTEEEIEIVENS